MSFEVRAVEPEGGEEAPVIGRFTDDEWWNLTALAHECGFDPDRENERSTARASMYGATFIPTP